MVSASTNSIGRRLGVLATMIAAILLFALPQMSAFAAKGGKVQGKVTAVTATSITIESKKTGSATYTLAPTAIVTIDGKIAKATDFKVGMRVRIASVDGKTATVVETVVRKKRAAPIAPVAPAPAAPAPVTPPVAPVTPPATTPQ